MVTITRIRWGRYGSYSGPFYYGTCKWKLPETHDFLDEAFYVTQAAEGSLNSVNMYDRCICTVGSIQFCDAYPQLSVMKLLGRVIEEHPDPTAIYAILQPVLNASQSEFKKNARGQWRFFLKGKEVNSKRMQQKLYLGGSSGLTGEWSKEQTLAAKTWASCFASIFEDQHAQNIQAKFTKERLMSFVQFAAKETIFGSDQPAAGSTDETWAHVLQAAYISFAVNNPTWAAKALKVATTSTKFKKWSGGYVIDCLRSLVYNRQIKLYPIRYAAIRPELEKIYGIDLPTSANELATSTLVADSNGNFTSNKQLQKKLAELGYYDGKIDGILGKGSGIAMDSFRRDHDLSSQDNMSTIVLTAIHESLPAHLAIEPVTHTDAIEDDKTTPAVMVPAAPKNTDHAAMAIVPATPDDATATSTNWLTTFLGVIKWIIALFTKKKN